MQSATKFVVTPCHSALNKTTKAQHFPARCSRNYAPMNVSRHNLFHSSQSIGSLQSDAPVKRPQFHHQRQTNSSSKFKPSASLVNANLRSNVPIKKRKGTRLFQFVKQVLDEGGRNCLRWEDEKRGIFTIVDGDVFAFNWSQKKKFDVRFENLLRQMRLDFF